MAFPTPDVTVFTWTVNDMNDLLSKMYTHFNSVSTKWNTVNENGTPDGQESFTITPAGSETFHLNFRYTDTTNQIYLLLDPLGNVTNSGTASPSASVAPTLTDSTQDSTEISAFRCTTGNTKGWLLEFDDALMFLTEDILLSYFDNCWHAGKIFTPYWASDNLTDFDGLGILGSIPSFTAGSNAHYLISAATSANCTRAVRLGTTSWRSAMGLLLEHNFGHNDTQNVSRWDSNGAMSYASPSPLPVYFSSATHAVHVGYFKYIYNSPVPLAPKSRIQDQTAAVRFMHIGITASTSYYMVPWDLSTVP